MCKRLCKSLLEPSIGCCQICPQSFQLRISLRQLILQRMNLHMFLGSNWMLKSDTKRPTLMFYWKDSKPSRFLEFFLRCCSISILYNGEVHFKMAMETSGPSIPICWRDLKRSCWEGTLWRAVAKPKPVGSWEEKPWGFSNPKVACFLQIFLSTNTPGGFWTKKHRKNRNIFCAVAKLSSKCPCFYRFLSTESQLLVHILRVGRLLRCFEFLRDLQTSFPQFLSPLACLQINDSQKRSNFLNRLVVWSQLKKKYFSIVYITSSHLKGQPKNTKNG